MGVWRRLWSEGTVNTTTDEAAEVRAELEHHVRCLVEELVAAGTDPAEARAEALRRFGDPAAIENECLRIRNGGRIMLHRVHLALTTLLFVSVVMLWFRSRHASLEAARAAELMHERAEYARLLAEEQSGLRTRPVVIRVGDELAFVSPTNPDLRFEETVAEDGRILVPELGWVSVVGLTREQAEAQLTEALRPYFLEPDVKIKVEHTAPRLDSVLFESF